MASLSIKDIQKSKEVKVLLEASARQMDSLGFTEHSYRHCRLVSNKCGEILEAIGESEEVVELGRIAGYIHDIGNAVNRNHHAMSGALLAYDMLIRKGMSYEDATAIMMAIANHDEGEGAPVSNLASALILADKADVHRSRVRNRTPETFDIHDRVNYAVTLSSLTIADKKAILALETDTSICPVMDYFEIFLERMKLCRGAAEHLGLIFELYINDTKLL
ncbi:MAG TPA: HD domain-containing protein [Bacillota bacterium]|nr:HD domain-containing protein [Bacillota bacterium]HPE39197.1 HD domain-containing protein [Bacillota bacterium]